MRIVQFVETLETGGVERLAATLALTQRATGHEVSVYCLSHAGPLRGDLDSAGIPVIEFHKEERSRAALTGTLAAQLRRDRPDILHGHNPRVHHYAAVARRLAGVPVCVNTRHGAWSPSGEPYDERYFRRVRHFTDHVIFNCESVRRQLEPNLGYSPEKCAVILNGIFSEPFLWHPAAPGGKLPKVRFGAIGRLIPGKDHARLIDAFACVAARVPEADLRIYGCGPLEPQLHEQIRNLGLAGRVHLEGRTDDPARVFETLDVFVLPSLYEGLPLVVLEAMAAGLPIVSTRAGGVLEVAPSPETSWLCDPGDTAGLAAAMSQAAASPQLASMGECARRLALANYGIARASHQYQQLYTTLLEARSSRHAR